MPSTLAGSPRSPQGRSPAPREVRRPPIAGEGRIEHLAQPVQDHRLVGVGEHLVHRWQIVLGPARNRASARLAIRMMRPSSSGSPGAARDRRGSHRRGCAPRRDRAGRCRAVEDERVGQLRPVRRISSSAPGQSSPMPRCAVSIASAMPRPGPGEIAAEDERRVPVDSPARRDRWPVKGSATTWAAEKTTRAGRAERRRAIGYR